MSFSAAHESKLARRACQICHHRKARFSFRGDVRADRSHVLCFECYRSERNRQRAQLLLELENPAFLRPLHGSSSPLTTEQVTHRRRMLAHLGATRALVVRRLG